MSNSVIGLSIDCADAATLGPVLGRRPRSTGEPPANHRVLRDRRERVDAGSPTGVPPGRTRMVGFSLFAQSPTTIATAWREILPLIVRGSVTPIVDRVYPLGEAGEALRHPIEDRPLGKVVLAGRSK
jgi:hypothetical protein